ncbi:MAG: putative toxin-antitoxin system toxin component, PIN family [Candidatus Omnitrophica bacterium]|nr:putative toxin-antitoxin system toxin component, PIN family [Candidatus Omnitrophota bacterium]
MLHAVVDANVFISALLHGRGTRPLLTAFLARQFQLITSTTLVDELASVIGRPRWSRAFDPLDCHDLFTSIREAATFVTPSHHVTVCRDPEDNALLDAALAGRADCLVTGDHDLLALHPFRGMRILRPAEFLRLLT